MSGLLRVSSSPHIKDEKTVTSVMRDVIIALTPALLGSVLFFSFRALLMILISVLSCVLFEFLYNLILKKKQTIGDLSAVVTGILIAFNVPVAAPVWIPVVASAFAILVVKMLYGGIGKNIVNPALAGRIFVFLSFGEFMSGNWIAAGSYLDKTSKSIPLFTNMVDVVSSATPLSYLKEGNGALLNDIPLFNAFVGTTGGCIGETSAILLIIGGLYLLYKRIITWHIPVSFLGTVAVITFIFPTISDMSRFDFVSYQLFSGGLMLGAIFMATDYATSPVTPLGRIIYGIGCGLITVFIRYFGGYPEGVSYAILLMNFLTWFIDKNTIPTKFGGETKYAKLIARIKAKIKK